VPPKRDQERLRVWAKEMKIAGKWFSWRPRDVMVKNVLLAVLARCLCGDP